MNLSQLIDYLSRDQEFQSNLTKWTEIKAKEAHDEAVAVESYKTETTSTGGGSAGTTLGDLLKEQISGGSDS